MSADRFWTSPVRVATGSLRALSAAFTGPRDPLQAFHKGELPVIIDALDEGRLLSNAKRFESSRERTGGERGPHNHGPSEN